MKTFFTFAVPIFFLLGCTSEEPENTVGTTCSWHYDDISPGDELFDSDLNSLTILSDGTLLAASGNNDIPFYGYIA